MLKIQSAILRQRCYGKRMTAATPAERTFDWRALFENASPPSSPLFAPCGCVTCRCSWSTTH